jgi:hypothetical protein
MCAQLLPLRTSKLRLFVDEGAAAPVLGIDANLCKLLWVMDWKHAQADSIEQLEYRGIRANTKRKGKQSYKRETRIEP